MRVFEIEDKTRTDVRFLYDRKCPPNSSVSRTWTTWGLAHDEAQITFVEYVFYDKDPDGVREAYGCTYDSEYSLTVNAELADPEKLFVYALSLEGEGMQGVNIDPQKARAVYVFPSPMSLTAEALLRVTEQAERAREAKQDVEVALKYALFGNAADGVCLAIFPTMR